MINSMTFKGYAASMVFDAEDKVIVGRVLDVDDIISFHGESIARRNSEVLPKDPPVAKSCCASRRQSMQRH